MADLGKLSTPRDLWRALMDRSSEAIAKAAQHTGRELGGRLGTQLRKQHSRPWQCPWMEATYGNWYGMFTLYDATGRQLGEANTFPSLMRDPNVPHEWRDCPYKGSRNGHPFSVAALRQVTSEWAEVLADVSATRCAYVKATGLEGPLPLSEIHVLARTVSSVPAFLVRRVDTSIQDHALPTRHAAAFKVVAGVHMMIEELLTNNITLLTLLEPEEIYQLIEEFKLFHSETGAVCGGPKKMVLELLHLLVHGDGHTHATASERCEHPCFSSAELQRIVDYGQAATRLELLKICRTKAVAKKTNPPASSVDSNAALEALASMHQTNARVQAALSNDNRETLYPRVEEKIKSAIQEAFDDACRALGRPTRSIPDHKFKLSI